MKKSMIAAVVAATAFAATANAGWFVISGASYNPGSVDISGSGFTAGSGTMVTNTNYLLDGAQTGTPAAAPTALTGTSVTNLTTGLGAALVANTVTYFSFRDGAGLGYFGFAFNNTTGSNFLLSVTTDGGASNGTLGTMTTGGTGSYDSFNGEMTANFTIANSSTVFVVFGGLSAGDGFNMTANRAVAETKTFNINYLSWGGTAFNVVGSGTNATTSSLSVATYVVPVPAPALLAGAGLIGAAALRRRMAKKA